MAFATKYGDFLTIYRTKQPHRYCNTIVPILKRTIINILLAIMNGVILEDIIS